MAIDLTKYYRFDTAKVKNTNAGGRVFSAESALVLPNGVLGYLGDVKANKPEVREFLAPTEDLIKTAIPCVVAAPEIVADESSRANAQLGLFRNPANKAFPAIELTLRDEIVVSDDYLLGKAAAIEKGDMFVVNTDGLLTHSAAKPESAAHKVYFKVTDIKKSSVATFWNGTALAPVAYNLYSLEVVVL